MKRCFWIPTWYWIIWHRQPFAEYAHRLFALGEAGQIALCMSSLSICNLYYLLRKLNGKEQTLVLLGMLVQVVEVTPVGKLEIHAALASGFKDFEDAVQTRSAEAGGNVAVIITRNQQDFPAENIPVQSPEESLAAFEKKGML